MRARSLVAAALGIAGVTGCSAISDPVTEIPQGPVTTFAGAPAAGCAVANPKSVLIDATHDGGVWWFPQKDHFFADSAHQGRALANYLRAKGYIVTELGRGQTMSPDSLMKYPIVIRAGYYYDNIRHFESTPADLAAYEAYSSCGRTVVLLSDYMRDGRKDHLADRFGIPLDGNITGSIDSFTGHALTAGVTQLPYIAGSYLTSESSASVQVLGRVGSNAVMGLLTGRAAKIFFIGDTNGIEQMPQPFVDNLIAWGF